MKKLLILTLLFLYIKTANCQTYVSGGILANTTWSLSGSPYIVTGNILVIASATLTIEPGVVVKFHNGTNLEIRGNMIASGTVNDSISFTSSATNPVPGLWNGINHWNTITLNYVKMTYASDCIENTGTPDIHINHSYFAYNTIAINNLGYNDTESIENTLFEYNGTGLGHVSNADYITNCIFQNNGIGIGYIYSTMLSSCSFFGNSVKGADVINAHVVGNLFQNNYVGLRVKVFNQGFTTINNTITNNQIGVQIRGEITLSPNTNVYNNTICNNTIYNMELSDNVSCYVENNCWCTTDSVAIANSIYDAYDNLALGVVFYWPFQTNCTSGIAEENKIEVMHVFPNPVTHGENLYFGKDLINSTIEVYNSLGARVQFIDNFNGNSMNIIEFSPGLYFIKVRHNKQFVGTGKFLVADK